MAKYKIISIPQYAPGGETNWPPDWLKKKKKKPFVDQGAPGVIDDIMTFSKNPVTGEQMYPQATTPEPLVINQPGEEFLLPGDELSQEEKWARQEATHPFVTQEDVNYSQNMADSQAAIDKLHAEREALRIKNEELAAQAWQDKIKTRDQEFKKKDKYDKLEPFDSIPLLDYNNRIKNNPKYNEELESQGYFVNINKDRGYVELFPSTEIQSRIFNDDLRTDEIVNKLGVGTKETIEKSFGTLMGQADQYHAVKTKNLMIDLMQKGMSREAAVNYLVKNKRLNKSKEALEKLYSKDFTEIEKWAKSFVAYSDDYVKPYQKGQDLSLINRWTDNDIITLARDRDFIDGRGANIDIVSPNYSGNADWGAEIMRKLRTGQYGWKPKSNMLIKLKLDESYKDLIVDPNPTDKALIEKLKDYKTLSPQNFNSKYTPTIDQMEQKWKEGKVAVKIEQSDAWRPNRMLVTDPNKKGTFGHDLSQFYQYSFEVPSGVDQATGEVITKRVTPDEMAGQTVYMTKEEAEKYNKAMVSDNMYDLQTKPSLWHLPGAIALGGATVMTALPGLSYAPIKALPWLTAGNALNAYFAYETLKPQGFAQKAYESFSKGEIGEGIENTVWGGLGLIPLIKPALGTARALKELGKPGSLGVLPINSQYSLAYKTPLQSGVVIGNPNIGKATETFTSITSPLNKFTKHAELGEIKIFKQTPRNYRSGSDASYATQGVLSDAKIVEDAMVQSSRTGILGENFIKEQITGVPKSIDTTVPLVAKEIRKPINIDQVLKDESISAINEIEPTLSKYNVKGKDAKKQFFQDLQEDLDFQIFKENAKITDPITGAMQSTFGVPNVQDDFFKGQGLTEEYAVNNDIAGATENLTDDVIKFSKEDNQVASDIINDMRVKKIDLWKTAEGQKRLKKMIDNTPSLKGQTPETLIEGVAKMENLNNFYAEELKISEDLKKQYEQIEIFHNEGKLSNDEFFNMSVQLDNQIKKSDEFLDKTEALFKHAGFYSSRGNVIGIRPGAFTPEELEKVTAHELGHFLGGFGPQKSSTTYLDDMLKDLKLIDDTSEQLVIPGLETESSKAYSLFGQGAGNYLDKSLNYFLTGSKGTEKVPMLAEVRQTLLEEGIIKSEYDKITPKMLRDHYKNYKNRLGEKYPLRIYDIIKDRPENFKTMSKVLNYLPMVAGAAGVIEEMSNEDDSRENMEAGLGKFLPLLLLAPLGIKLSKKLRGLADSFSKVGTLALQELKYKDLRYLKKEIKTLTEEWHKLGEELGYNMRQGQDVFKPTPPGLIQEQKRLASIQDQRTRKFQGFLKSRDYDPSIPKEEQWMNPLPAQGAVNDKKEIVDLYNQAGIDFRITPEGIEGGGYPNMFEGVTTTGQQTVTDLSTGQPVQAQVTLPRNTTEYTLVDGQLIEKNINVENPIISTEYVQSLRNSKVDVESKIPGSIVFGSSLLVTDAGMPHITGDIDILISQSDYNKHVKDKFQFVQDYGPAKQHAVYPDYGKEGVLDFNIVHEDAKGMIIPYYNPNLPEKVPMEIELFRQFYPEKFQEAATRAAVSGKPFEINMSSKEFMAGIDPQVKTIIDSYEISPYNRWGTYNPNKEKHILRPDVLIAYGNPEVVAKGQEAYIKSVVGHKGTLGHQFTKEELSNVGNNVDALFNMNFTGDYMATANNPERMQLAINDFYINNTVFSRDISMKTMPGGKYTEKNIKTAFSEWYPGKGGSVNGIGINFVQKGNPTHLSKWDNPILGHRQLGIKTDTSDPLKYVNSVNRATSGEYVFTEEETKLIEDLVDKYIPDVKSRIPSTGFKSRDILNWDPYDLNKAAKFLDDFTEQTGIRAIRKEEASGTYGVANPAYASVFGKFDELADAMMYSLKDYAVSPKTLNERKRQINAIKQKNASSKTLGWGNEPLDVKTPEDFKKMYSILDGGLATAESRLQNLTDHLSKLNSYKEDLIQKMATGPNDIELQKVSDQIRTSENRIRKILEIKTELEQKQKQAKVFMKILGIGSLGAGLLIGGVELYDMQEKREGEKEENLKKRIKTFNKLRGVNVTKKVMEGIPDIMSSWLLNNPTATKWPNGEAIEIDDMGKYGDFIRRPMYIKRKPYNPLLHFTEDWEWHYPEDHDTKENQKYKHGGEKSLEMELTPEQIKYYVSRGYIVVAE